MTHLAKPDMPAVLERTHLATNFDGFMLPIYEAGSNSIHSLLEKFSVNNVAANGQLKFTFSSGTSPEDFSVTISDNGNGLDDTNFKEFITPFTGHKLKKGGKGFGRFVAFKVFDDVYYFSRSKAANGPEKTTAFKFDIFADEELLNSFSGMPPESATGCSVTYRNIKHAFRRNWDQISSENLLDHLSSNSLTYLVDGRMPQTTVSIDGKDYDLRDHFKKVFSHEKTHEFKLDLRGHTFEFKCDISRVARGKPFSRHNLLFFADNRLVGAGRAIENKIGRSAFQREDGSEYVVIASLSSEFLDKHANQARTQLEVTEEEISQIVDKSCDAILATEVAQHEAIKSTQRDEVISLLMRHPLLRYGLNGHTVSDYVKNKPNYWIVENFVSDLAVQRLREERRWSNFVQTTIADERLFEERKSQLLDRVSETYRDALAEYIVHRKAVIEIADQLRGSDDSGKMKKEDAFHQLIFPRMQDSQTTKYFQHNLWMLDERLAFVSYVSSDRTLHGGRRQQGDKITDIAFFEECYVAGGKGNHSVAIVEFKRPGRDDYAFGVDGKDPVKQVHDTVEHIRLRKSFVTTSKTTIDIPESMPIVATIVADLEPTLRTLARRYNFSETWDKSGLVHYHDDYKIFVEIYGFSKLISDAQMRNAAFFDILLKDLGS